MGITFPKEFPKTKQEMFDIVARHLLTQKVHAVAGGWYLYRLFDIETNKVALACAIGACIPEDKYDAVMDRDHLLVRDIIETFFNDDDDYDDDFINFADDLRRIHDHYEVDEWLEKLKQCGSKHSLDLSVLKPFE